MLLFLSNVGCRWGDMIKMKVEDIVYEDNKIDESIGYKRCMITFFMRKIRVQREPVKVPRNKLVQKIWIKYSKGKHGHHFLFPRNELGNGISNNKFNKYVKDVCRIVGLNRRIKEINWDLKGSVESSKTKPLHEMVTSHIGRKTFIKEQVLREAPTRVIMSMTGHKIRKVVDGYYEILDKEKRDVNDDLFSDDLKQKPSTIKSISTNQKTSSNPFSKQQEDEIEKLKYSLDKGWISQIKYDDLFQKIFDDN